MSKKIAVLLVLALCRLGAQVGTQGSIVGTVVDQSGGVIVGATVTAVQLETGFKRTGTTDGGGNFELVALPIGPYSVTVTAAGMQTWVLDRMDLTVGARVRVAPTLQPGAVQQRVTVEANAEILQTAHSSVSTTIQIATFLNWPLAVRNPVSIVGLVQGMRYDGASGPEQGAYVHGNGMRSNASNFKLDGVSSNAAMDEGAMTMPIVDDIAEMNVQTSSFSAEYGRDPIQVTLVTKSGTNDFHGSAWEYFRNDVLNARNAFATTRPRLRYNQFGGNFGGPIKHDKTFFFGSFQATLNPGQTIYNSVAATPDMLKGNLSSIKTPIKDPLNGKQFSGNVIPASRINPASSFFVPYLPQANNGNLFQALASNFVDTYEDTVRLDHYLTSSQRIYVRWVRDNFRQQTPQYLPSYIWNNNTDQDNIGLNYSWTIKPNMLLTATAGYIHSDNNFSSPQIGKVNYSEEAGIQGIPTAGRENNIGLPAIAITGFAGITEPFGVNGALWSRVQDGSVELRILKGTHSIGLGYELQNRQVYGAHGSTYSQGLFNFNGQYTGNPLADYLLGYSSSSTVNLPLAKFGVNAAPYSGIYVEDSWRAQPRLTFNVGLRYEYWHSMSFVAGNTATFDPQLGKVVAGEENGQVNLTHQPIAAALGAATSNLWVPASQVPGVPNDLYPARGHLEPRVGFVWQPFGFTDLVIRSAYGIFQNSLVGNRSASTIGAIPFFSIQTQTFAASQLVDWRSIWAAGPNSFVTPSVNYTAGLGIDTAETQEWNFSLQKALWWQSALTVGYVGTKINGQPYGHAYNEVPPGRYTNLQAAKPFRSFGTVYTLENGISTWYHALQLQWERRFNNGVMLLISYSFSKSMQNYAAATGETTLITPFAPVNYERGPAVNNSPQNLKLAWVYELPFGRSRLWATHMNRALEAVLGGWEFSGYYAYVSGTPLSIAVPGATLGNGWNTRANLVGDPHLDNPSASLWFSPKAFAAPAPYQFGNSGIGVVYGPPIHQANLALLKAFYFREKSFIQIRAEANNAFNNVNLANPNVNFGTTNFGSILSASSARVVQLGARIVF